MAKKIRGATALTGGGTGAVDAISGSVLADGDVVMAFAGGQVYPYVVDADSGLSESSPNIIAPDTSPGDKRLILQHFPHEIDALCTYGGGVNYTQATILSALTAIGTVNKTTLLLRPGTWVISSNADWSAYTNVVFRIAPGAVISHGAFTLNIPNPDAGLYQWLSGTGAVTFSGNVNEIYPEWFLTNTTPGTTDVTAGLQAALTAASGRKLKLSATTYKITTTLTMPSPLADIEGVSSVASIIKPVSCDGITFPTAAPAYYDGLRQLYNFAIVGDGTTGASYNGIKSIGTADVGDKIYWVSIHGMKIRWMGTGIYFRNIRSSNIYDNYIDNVRDGIKFAGQVLRVTVRDNNIYHDTTHAMGAAASIGINITSASDYDPGGSTEHNPESITLENNQVYSFDTGANVHRGLYHKLIGNDFDNTYSVGIAVSAIEGTLNIENNWISLGLASATHGINFTDLGALTYKKAIVKGNHITSSVVLTLGTGIRVGDTQTNVLVEANTIDTMTGNDILVNAGHNSSIIGNFCYSNVTDGIDVQHTGYGITTIRDNYVRGAINFRSNNTGGIDRGPNTGTDSTYKREYVVSAASLDTTAAIVLTYYPQASYYAGHFLEIIVAIQDDTTNVRYSSVVRYSLTTADATIAAVVTDATHDLIGGVTEAVGVAFNVVTVTITCPTSIDHISVYVTDITAYAPGYLQTVTVN